MTKEHDQAKGIIEAWCTAVPRKLHATLSRTPPSLPPSFPPFLSGTSDENQQSSHFLAAFLVISPLWPSSYSLTLACAFSASLLSPLHSP